MKKQQRLPKMTEIKDTNLQQMVERVRLAAWRRKGELETVQRLRKDKGFAKAVAEHAINIVAMQRAPLFRDAMNAAMRNKIQFKQDLETGKGLWFDEMGPLAPAERSLVLKELHKMWDIQEVFQRPDVH